MNFYLLIAAVLTLVLGLIHSILGEILIFRFLYKGGVVDETRTGLRTRQVRALWTTWHLMSLFGCAIAVILLNMSGAISNASITTTESFVGQVLLVLFMVSAIFWMFGTRGKHPAWIVFLIIAGSTWYGLQFKG